MTAAGDPAAVLLSLPAPGHFLPVMRRHPFLTAYLILLTLSTLFRAGLVVISVSGSLRSEDEDQRATFYGGPGTPVVALGDAARGWQPVEVADHLQSQSNRVAFVRDGVDPSPVIDPRAGPPVDLVALGTAGPAAIALAVDHPDRVRSLTLVDADGIEEFDLLGDHNLNQVVRRAQLAGLELADWLIPHFLFLDPAIERSEARAARLISYDRRGIREQFARWNGPTAIYVSDSAPTRLAMAREHARLLPQSTLGPWDPDSLDAFLARVDAGTATTRATADPARIAAAALPFDAHGVSSAEGSALYILLLLLALTTLLSEDLACVTAGMLAARGSIPLLPAIIACYLGIILGDQLLYLLGRSAGRALVTRIPVKWILTPERLDRAVEWFQANGMQVVLTSRFLPGTRFPVYVAAGILRGGFIRFALWLMAIGALWTPALVGLSYEATRTGRATIEGLPGATWLWALGLIIGGTILLRLLVPLVTAQGRKEAAASLRKAARTGLKSPSE